MSRAAGTAKQKAQTHAGARVPTELYRRVMAKVAAEGTTLRQVLMDLLAEYVHEGRHHSSTAYGPASSKVPDVPRPVP